VGKGPVCVWVCGCVFVCVVGVFVCGFVGVGGRAPHPGRPCVRTQPRERPSAPRTWPPLPPAATRNTHPVSLTRPPFLTNLVRRDARHTSARRCWDQREKGPPGILRNASEHRWGKPQHQTFTGTRVWTRGASRWRHNLARTFSVDKIRAVEDSGLRGMGSREISQFGVLGEQLHGAAARMRGVGVETGPGGSQETARGPLPATPASWCSSSRRRC